MVDEDPEQTKKILASAIRFARIVQKGKKPDTKSKETITKLKAELKVAKDKAKTKKSGGSSELGKLAERINANIASGKSTVNASDVKKLAGRLVGMDSVDITRADMTKLGSLALEVSTKMPKPQKAPKAEKPKAKQTVAS